MNISSNLSCFTPQTFENITEFYECYELVLKENALIGSCGIILTISVFVTNLWVMIMLITKEHVNVFDKILIGHAFVDWWTSIYNISWKHFVDVFGYWPLSYSFGISWEIYDQSHQTVTALHMLYMSWIRLRSIQNPKNYKNELIAKYPILMMISVFINLTLTVTSNITNVINYYKNKTHSETINSIQRNITSLSRVIENTNIMNNKVPDELDNINKIESNKIIDNLKKIKIEIKNN